MDKADQPLKPFNVLIVDDDPDDRLLIRDALAEVGVSTPLVELENGEELMDYLQAQGKWAHRKPGFLPGIILLDLNMPRMDGREALRALKTHPDLRKIPVVVLTTSRSEEDVERSYASGVNTYLTKPLTYTALLETLRTLRKYWFEMAYLPTGE